MSNFGVGSTGYVTVEEFLSVCNEIDLTIEPRILQQAIADFTVEGHLPYLKIIQALVFERSAYVFPRHCS